MTQLLDRPIIPVSNPKDAARTYEAVRPYLLDVESTPIIVHVIEKAGGAPDKASVEQRQLHAEKAFDAFRKRAQTDGLEIETTLRYGTDVAETIHAVAREHEASAIVFNSRGGGRWLQLLSGGVRAKLISDQECPVVVLPGEES